MQLRTVLSLLLAISIALSGVSGQDQQLTTPRLSERAQVPDGQDFYISAGFVIEPGARRHRSRVQVLSRFLDGYFDAMSLAS